MVTVLCVCLQSMVLTMFHLIFFFVPLNQGFEEASVGFVVNGKVVNGKVHNLHYLSNKYVCQAPQKMGQHNIE